MLGGVYIAEERHGQKCLEHDAVILEIRGALVGKGPADGYYSA